TVKCPKGILENVLVEIDKFVFLVDFIMLDMPEDIKTPLILGRPFLSTAHAKIDVFKRKIILRVGNDKVVFKSEKPTSNIIKKVYVLSLRERIKLDLEARLMGEALILNRSLDPLYGDYIELNDLNEPLELKRNQVDDFGPTIKEGEVIDEPVKNIVKTRCDDEIIDGLDEYPSYYDFDRKIHIHCAYNLQFSCMIGYEHVNANFFPLLSINVMSKSFYNSIMKDKVEFKEKNVIGAFMNVPIFVGNFSVVTDFAVVKNMDFYRDEGIGDIIVGRPFYKDREACVKTRQFDGLITIYKGNNSVTYQMARSHSRFKHLTNAQCNKMWPLLKVSAQDELKGISHPYQNLKGFYKGFLNLGPEYIKDEKFEEWLTRRHVSVYEME
ncbi:homeodomain-like protein, partial [Tanacetum coccineum]